MRVSTYFKNVNVLKSLYFAALLNKVEYTALIWYPEHAYHLQWMEYTLKEPTQYVILV